MSTVPSNTAAAYETLRTAIRGSRLVAAQIDALLAILAHLHSATDLLDNVDDVYPQYRDDPHMRMAVRAGLAESATNSYRTELAALAEAARPPAPAAPLIPT